jgi:hypothetical protein
MLVGVQAMYRGKVARLNGAGFTDVAPKLEAGSHRRQRDRAEGSMEVRWLILFLSE